MAEAALLSIMAVMVLGVAAQWLAWRARVAPILFFLGIGFLAGPVTGLLHPDDLLGDLLGPVISLGVAVILFEGGMSLRLREVRQTGPVVSHLVTFGALVTWLSAAAAAHWVLGLRTDVALLLGSILVVSGPTVVGPLLRFVRPRGASGPVLRWEGIVIDPVGALLAILVFEAIQVVDPGAAFLSVVASLFLALVIGSGLGVAGAAVVGFGVRRRWVPDYLHSAFVLAVVLAVFVASDLVQAESGLLAVTLMGVILANQKGVDLHHILAFKETLRVLIIPALFILLTARLTLADLAIFDARAIIFLFLLILVIRPITVLLASRNSALVWPDRAFIAGLMPRGIVAAAVASVFAFPLVERGVPGAEKIVPYTFLVIAGTGVFYSIVALPLGRLLNIAARGAGDVLIVGANEVGRAMAKALQRAGLSVHLIDMNGTNVVQANVDGLEASQANALSDHIDEDIDLERFDHVLVMTPNDETNILAALHLGDYVGRDDTYQLPSRDKQGTRPPPSKRFAGRGLFAKEWNFVALRSALSTDWAIKVTKITDEFTYADYQAKHGEHHVPLFKVKRGAVTPFTIIDRPEIVPGTQLVGLLRDDPKTNDANGPPEAALGQPGAIEPPTP